MKCLLCNRQFSYRLTLKDIFWIAPLNLPTICTRCRRKFNRITAIHCPGCCRQQKNRQLCTDCQCWQEKYGWYLKHHALFSYNAAMKEYMRRYKFMGDYRLRLVFERDFQETILSFPTAPIIPIPVTEETMKVRGFNQVLGLTEKIPTIAALKHCSTSKIAQSRKNRQKRLHTPQPFILDSSLLKGARRVILVDDIYTTGRTLYHAAILLNRAGVKEIISISLAR